MSRSRIAVVGSVNMDLVVRADHVPGPGENVFGTDLRAIPGGKGANQAVAAARLGAETWFVGRTGNDGFGSTLRESLEGNGVRTPHLKQDSSRPSGTALIVVDHNGQNSIIVCPGANAAVTPEDFDAAADAVSACQAIVTQLEIPLETVAHVIRRARQWRVPVVLDAGPPCPSPPDDLFRVDILTPNEAEAAALVAMAINSLEDAEAAARAMLHRGAGAVVLKLGDKGVLLVTRDERLHVEAHRIEPVDTTAAGDAFTAALAVYRAEGRSLPHAVRMATRAGALACLKPGAQPSMPTREEVETFTR